MSKRNDEKTHGKRIWYPAQLEENKPRVSSGGAIGAVEPEEIRGVSLNELVDQPVQQRDVCVPRARVDLRTVVRSAYGTQRRQSVRGPVAAA